MRLYSLSNIFCTGDVFKLGSGGIILAQQSKGNWCWKVLGASVPNIVSLLAEFYSGLHTIAIAAPLAYWELINGCRILLSHDWLDLFRRRRSDIIS
jgi:hypothetical protein